MYVSIARSFQLAANVCQSDSAPNCARLGRIRAASTNAKPSRAMPACRSAAGDSMIRATKTLYNMPMKSTSAILDLAWAGASLTAQTSQLQYPVVRKGDVVDDYAGRKVADPYRWMEDLNSDEVKAWVDAENAITFKYLDALPQRDAFQKRITEL